MPLNIDHSDDQETPPGGTPPFAASPREPGGNRRILLRILLVVVALSALVLLFRFVEFGDSREPPSPPAAVTGGSPPADGRAGREPAGGTSDRERAAALRARLGMPGGEYTIFIGALRDSADAGELAQRWTKAGFAASVHASPGWYRVGLGRYATPGLAREEAEKLRQALEDGYWIGRAAF
jgi:hypothetical protein